IRVYESLPTTMLDIFEPPVAVIVHKALIEVGRFALGVRCPEVGWYRFDDLTERVFAFPKGLLRLSSIIFGAFALGHIDTRSIPLDDFSMFVAQRNFVVQHPAKFTIGTQDTSLVQKGLASGQ